MTVRTLCDGCGSIMPTGSHLRLAPILPDVTVPFASYDFHDWKCVVEWAEEKHADEREKNPMVTVEKKTEKPSRPHDVGWDFCVCNDCLKSRIATTSTQPPIRKDDSSAYYRYLDPTHTIGGYAQQNTTVRHARSYESMPVPDECLGSVR